MSQVPTIRDIARKLGLGKSTVQRALATGGSISPQVRQRVIEAANELGYKRDPLFSILGSRGRRSVHQPLPIAYISHEVAGRAREFKAGVDVYGIAKARGEALGYGVERVDPDQVQAGKRLMNVLYNRGFVGALLGQIRSPDHEAIMANTHLPVVRCGRLDPLPLHTVQPDIAQMVRLAWRQMLNAGYRRIGAAICLHSPPVEDDSDRLGTLLQCQHETLSKKDRLPPLLASLADDKALLEWFYRYKPEAVLSFRSGQYYVLKDAGVDMSSIGFASLHTTAGEGLIAGINEPTESIPREALYLLDQLIRHRAVGVPDEPLHIGIPGRWVDGTSLLPKQPLLTK